MLCVFCCSVIFITITKARTKMTVVCHSKFIYCVIVNCWGFFGNRKLPACRFFETVFLSSPYAYVVKISACCVPTNLQWRPNCIHSWNVLFLYCYVALFCSQWIFSKAVVALLMLFWLFCLHQYITYLQLWVVSMIAANRSVPIQLAQCRFSVLE